MLVKFLMVTLLAVTCFARPHWFHNLAVQEHNYFIGYGEGISYQEANDNAIESIAKQLHTKVSTSWHKEILVKNDKVINEHRAYESDVHSNVVITGSEVLKKEREHGRYYVAIGYKNLTSIARFNQVLRQNKYLKDEPQNTYLEQTYLADQIIKKVDFEINRHNGAWYLHYQDLMEPLSAQEFSFLFRTFDNPQLKLYTKNIMPVMHHNDSMRFEYSSQKTGYVSLFCVYEDGTTINYFKNQKVEANATNTFPQEGAIENQLIDINQASYDMYVLLYHEKKERFDLFQTADETVTSGESEKKFNILIDRLDKRAFTTLKVDIKP